jgi:hypothetical protein
MQRFAFLSGYAARNDFEETEVWQLCDEFRTETGWDDVPRNTRADLGAFEGRNSGVIHGAKASQVRSRLP